jgi:putative DNA modification/repair radical SAM protein
MEELIEVARKLRIEHRFGGYIHLKAVAGASPDLLQKAGLYADRLSANIELPVQKDLDALAPAKTHTQIESSMSEIRENILESAEERQKFKRAPIYAPAGQSTQMIVGATASTDKSIVEKAADLYQTQKLKRVYYSAFSPIPDSHPGLPSKSPPLIREHRLYQADWLLRFYGFKASEIFPSDAPNLNLDLDPKLAWALRNRAIFPVDVNRAPKETLLRVPGLGVKTVLRILQLRIHRKLRLEDLGKLHVHMKTVRHFITAADSAVRTLLIDSPKLLEAIKGPDHEQFDLFASARSALSGEV